MSAVSEYLKEVKEDLDIYKRLKIEAPGSMQGWRKEGWTLLADRRVYDKRLKQYVTASAELTYFGTHGLQGKQESSALAFILAAHNLKLEEHLATLLRMVEVGGAGDKKLETCLPKKEAVAETVPAA
jgi:hypothetical protein